MQPLLDTLEEVNQEVEEKPKFLTKQSMADLMGKSKGAVLDRIYANNFEDFENLGYEWNPTLTSKDVKDGIGEKGRFVLIEII